MLTRGWLLAALLLLGACQRWDPEAQVTFSGRVVTSEGEPVRGIGLVASLLDCASHLAVASSARALLWTGASGANGEYELTIFNFQRENSCVVIAANDGEGRPLADLEIPRYGNPLELPDLVLWEDTLTVAPDGGYAVSAPPWDGGGQWLLYWQLLTPGGEVAWEERYEEPFVVSPLQLEDFGAELRGGALTSVLDVAGPYEFGGPVPYASRFSIEMRVWTPPVLLETPGRVPVSRGATCVFGGRARDPCPLTDGELVPVSLEEQPEPGASSLDLIEAFRLQLDRDVTPRWVVGRGGKLWLRAVEVSTDGDTWTGVAEGSCRSLWETYCLIELAPIASPIRFLRVLAQRGMPPEALAEFSVFEEEGR